MGVREVPAGARACVVDHAEVLVEEDTGAVALGEGAFFGVRIEAGVEPERVVEPHGEMGGDGRDLGGGNRDVRLAAAVGTAGAIDLAFDVRGDFAELVFGAMVVVQEAPEGEVFGFLLAGQSLDLYEVRDHVRFFRGGSKRLGGLTGAFGVLERMRSTVQVRTT